MAECEAAGRTIQGDARCGGQEHFYLEPMVGLHTLNP
jgi:xanthine dehydrogenase molybdopterin-binding subunit B